MKRRKLPIGIQSFAKIRSDDYYYVDKTALASKLIEEGSYYFLSRPRRFGKSLFLDTLKELFEGNEPLFQGLVIYDSWDWSIEYPVLRFSFGSIHYATPQDLVDDLTTQLNYLENQFGITSQASHPSGRFSNLLRELHRTLGKKVVVLVDEYDKPILDALQDSELARKNRDFLRGFYGTVKDYDAHIKFTFLTGVSKFSQVSLFSGLNNLFDITLDPDYSSLCGYTDNDIDTVFAPELDGLDREQIKSWYNGYSWLGEHVYNPYDVLNLFKKRIFKNYWFETGTPTFLVDLLFNRHVSSLALNSMHSSSSMLSSFDVDNITTEALLFQTGYLTLKKQRQVGSQIYYTLGYPNQEVHQSLNELLLSTFTQNKSAQSDQSILLYDLLLRNDFDGLKALFHSFFASIPYHWYTSNDVQTFEGFYASVFYSYFAALGLDVVVEDCSNHGRLDMVLKFNNQVYLFEFKVVELAPNGKALQQIKDKHYADKYRALNHPIHLIGVEFSKVERNIVGFDVERG